MDGCFCVFELATFVFATATTVITAVSAAVTATATAEDDEDKDDYPTTVTAVSVTEKVTHLRCLLSFTLHTIANLKICYREKKYF